MFDPVRDDQGSEHGREVGVDRFAFVVVDRSGLQVVFGHSEALLDAPQLVVGADDELRGLSGEVGGATMLPVINAFKAAHQLTDVTVVADAGMISESNQVAIHVAGLSFILGTRIPFLPNIVAEWRQKNPGKDIPDGHVLTQPWPATSSEKARGIPDRVVHYQYRHNRARRSLRLLRS